MPFDGDLQPHEHGWTIKVEPSPSILQQWQRWSSARRRAYHEMAAGVAYHVVTAIQNNALRKRRERLPLPQGAARYFLRQLRNEPRTICATIFEVHFHDPDCDPDHDPDGGEPAPLPLDPLVLDIIGHGRRYSIVYVEGVLPLPPRTNRIERFRTVYAETLALIPSCATVEFSQYLRIKILETNEFIKIAAPRACRTTKVLLDTQFDWKETEAFGSIYPSSANSRIGLVLGGSIGIGAFVQNPTRNPVIGK